MCLQVLELQFILTLWNGSFTKSSPEGKIMKKTQPRRKILLRSTHSNSNHTNAWKKTWQIYAQDFLGLAHSCSKCHSRLCLWKQSAKSNYADYFRFFLQIWCLYEYNQVYPLCFQIFGYLLYFYVNMCILLAYKERNVDRAEELSFLMRRLLLQVNMSLQIYD